MKIEFKNEMDWKGSRVYFPFPNQIYIKLKNIAFAFGILSMTTGNGDWETFIMYRVNVKGYLHFRFLFFAFAYKINE